MADALIVPEIDEVPEWIAETRKLAAENWPTPIYLRGGEMRVHVPKLIRGQADTVEKLHNVIEKFRDLPHDGKHDPGDYPYSCLGCRAYTILEEASHG